MTDKKPDGWVEPVNESLLRPPSFFGATPRWFVLAVYAACVVACFIGATSKSWATAGVAVAVAVFAQVITASLTFIEPNWFELFVEWLKSPQTRVDP